MGVWPRVFVLDDMKPSIYSGPDMTSDNEHSTLDTALSDAAIDWLVRLHSGRATEADHESFAMWRGQSADHEHAALEAEAIWQGVGPAGNQVRTAGRKIARRKVTRRALLGVAAIGVTVTALGVSGALGPFPDHETKIGERRRVALPDGSTAFLNADTALAVNFSSSRRALTLIRGQAVFHVTRDVDRPFVVEARGGAARALGTTFDVDIRPSDVVVTVLEGNVAVGTGVGLDVTAKGDQRVRYRGRTAVSAAENVDAGVETAWQRGKLIFNQRPLGDVVAEIERYRAGRIVILRPDIATLEVTGVFELQDPDSILRTIEENLPVRVTRLPFVTFLR